VQVPVMELIEARTLGDMSAQLTERLTRTAPPHA
jgi:hypothetical protein